MGGRLSAIGAAVRGVFFKAAVTISLIPSWMAGVTWQMFDKFLSLVSEGYKKNSVLYACIRFKATSAAEPPLKIYRKDRTGKLEEIPDHPLRLLLERPNPLMTEFEWIELLTTHLEIGGRTYWWKERSNAGQVIGLWPLRPDRVEPILGANNRALLAGWRYWIDGQHWDLPARDVWTTNYPDPADETGGILGGLGPVQVLAREIDTDNEATNFVYAFLRNFASPGVVIQSKAKLNKKEAEEIRGKFREKYGAMNRGEPAIVDGETTITTLSHSMRDMTMPDVRSLSEARIASAIGVPPILVGLKVGLDRSTFSNMQEAGEYFTERTLSALWRRLADQVTYDLLREFDGSGDLVAVFDTSNVRALAGQQKEKAQRYEKAFRAGALTLNLYLQHGLGLDTIPNGDVFYVPNNVTVTPVADLGKPPPKPEPLALPPPAPGEDEEDPPVTRRRKLAELEEAARALAHDVKLAVAEAKAVSVARRRIDGLSGPLADTLATWFASLGDRLIDRLTERAGKGLKAANDDDWLTTADTAEFVELVSAGHAAAVERAGQVAATELAIEGSWSLPPTDALGLVDELATRIAGIDATTRAQVRAAIAEGLAAGEGIDGLALRIRQLVDEAWPSRAKTIARTETATAYNRGAILAYERSGLVEEVECLDGGECGWTSHEDVDKANGTRRSLKDASRYPICHPNCVRAFAPIVKD